MKKVLDEQAIAVIVRRMAYQVLEQFHPYKQIGIVGIKGMGYTLAQKLAALVSEQGLEVSLHKLLLDKHLDILPPIQIEPNLENLNGWPILLVDDVINSGRTLAYSLSSLLTLKLPLLKAAVLVERRYRNFPVSANITGISLNTTFEDNVIAVLEGNQDELGVFLV